jgi:hypothetical protein
VVVVDERSCPRARSSCHPGRVTRRPASCDLASRDGGVAGRWSGWMGVGPLDGEPSVRSGEWCRLTANSVGG